MRIISIEAVDMLLFLHEGNKVMTALN